MKILEFECKKCKFLFTRFASKEEKDSNREEKCIKCGEEAILKREVELKDTDFGCNACSGCSGCK